MKELLLLLVNNPHTKNNKKRVRRRIGFLSAKTNSKPKNNKVSLIMMSWLKHLNNMWDKISKMMTS